MDDMFKHKKGWLCNCLSMKKSINDIFWIKPNHFNGDVIYCNIVYNSIYIHNSNNIWWFVFLLNDHNQCVCFLAFFFQSICMCI